MSDQIPNAEEQAPDIEAVFQQVMGLPVEKQVPALISMLQAVIGQMADIDERLCKVCEDHEELDREIHEDFFGPIHKQVQLGNRMKGIDGLKERYGSQFDPIADSLKAFGVDDVYSFLFDQLEKLKKEPDYTDEMGHESVMNFYKGGMDRINRIKGIPPEPPEGAKEEGSEAKPATSVEVAIEKKPEGSIKDKLAAGKRRSGILSGY